MKFRSQTGARACRILCWIALIGSFRIQAQVSTGPSVVEFEKSHLQAKENDGQTRILIRRSGNTNAASTATLLATNGTARAGVDYQPLLKTVVLAPGSRETSVDLALMDNTKEDGDRSLDLILSNPSAGTELGAVSRAVLTILDNDKPAATWQSLGLDRLSFLKISVAGIPLWQYVVSFIYIFLAFYISKLLDVLLTGKLKRLAQKTKIKLDDLILEMVRGPLRIIVFVLLLHVGLQVFQWPSWLEHFVSQALQVIVAVAITYVLLKLIDLLMNLWREKSAGEEGKLLDDQLFPIIRKSLKLFVVVVAALVTAQNLEFDITALLASLSIGGLALGLAAQDTLSNLFGAVAIFADKPFRIGDRIQLESVDGMVESIGLRSTRVRNLDGHLITIPNKTMGNATITNVTKRPNIKTIMTIGITYDTPYPKVKRAIEILSEIYKGHPMTFDVWISFKEFADSSLGITVIHWYNSTVYQEYLAGMQELNLEIKRRFDEEQISFAFPTRTLFIKQDSTWQVGSESVEQ
jgi:MscS family membrane protein